MFRSRAPLLLLAAACAAGLLATGCDPKRIVGTGSSGTDGTSGSPQVQPEARAVTAILALHVEVLRAALSRSADYDAVPGAPPARGFTPTDCVAVTQYSALPAWEVRFEGCTDQNGTQLRGGGQTQPLTGVDGYYFFPYTNVEDKLIATNDGDTSFNHAYDSGTLEIAFQRNGSSVVDGVVVTKYMRHNRADETIQISYPGMRWAGTHGDWDAWPASGEKANGAWDSVSGPFEIEFTGSSTVFFSLAGIPYVADLGNGNVEVNQ